LVPGWAGTSPGLLATLGDRLLGVQTRLVGGTIWGWLEVVAADKVISVELTRRLP
jgi:hypothetical protein